MRLHELLMSTAKELGNHRQRFMSNSFILLAAIVFFCLSGCGGGDGATGGTISGKVVDSSNVAIQGAIVTVAGTTPMSATTDAAGSYSFVLNSNDTYNLSISFGGYKFSPNSSTVIVSNGNNVKQNFAAVSGGVVSGKVVDASNTGIQGATVNVAGTQTTTSATGSYTIEISTDGLYTATVSRSGYKFLPASIQLDLKNGLNIIQNFTVNGDIGVTGTYTMIGIFPGGLGCGDSRPFSSILTLSEDLSFSVTGHGPSNGYTDSFNLTAVRTNNVLNVNLNTAVGTAKNYTWQWDEANGVVRGTIPALCVTTVDNGGVTVIDSYTEGSIDFTATKN